MSSFKDLGGNILDTLGDAVEGIGDSFSNASDLEAAKTRRLNLNTELAALEFQANEERKARNEKTIERVIYVVIGFVVFAYVLNKAPEIKKLFG